VAAALISSYTGKPIESGCLFFGEMGLGGEIRSVPKILDRLKEAYRIGIKKAFLPGKAVKEIKTYENFELIGLDHVQELNDKI
jgi:DNA repair protein RadA/Sms